MWYESNEKNKIYRETLLRMEPYLKRIGFKGYFDINCIINKKGIFPLEATARLGHPTAQLQDTLHISKWGDLMKAIADGKNFNLQCKKGFGVIAFIGVPPYPYEGFPENLSPCGVEIFFKEKLKDEEINRIYFEEVSFLKNANGDFKFVIAGDCGYVAHVSGFGRTILKARKNAYDLIGKIVIPKMFYRTDIGEAFYYKNLKKLRKWGWLDSSWWKFGF
jgi:phosphoribosylamine--glycine ligase